ncbi:right-handed parallel beta-helix repeat-containing protein [Bacillus cereus]|uniref:right-handed parallel beta-helix repeat-containing protein n=1 Tax=Bacillus cereus TaxID=1396 RepID=UPI003D6580C8
MTREYFVELDQWGIKPGIPQKPYTDEDFIQADANIQGLNKAIQYAYSEGYTDIVLPTAEYAICYPKPIEMLNGTTLDLNRSKLKVIYDSDRKSPFDNRTTTDYYNFIGTSVSFAKAENALVRNGEIIGCREDRSFKDSKEVAVEHSYGVVFKQSARFCRLEDCTVRDYMGDNVTFESTGLIGYAEFDEGTTINSLDYKTGQPAPVVAGTKTVITKLLNIQYDSKVKFDTMFIGGLGYSRLTSLNNKYFDIFFYDKDDKFIGVHKKRRIYSEIQIPIGAMKYRFQFADETLVRNHSLTVWFGRIPSHNHVTRCDIRNGHRGGITLGGSHNTISYNTIRGNGKGTAMFLDGKPFFGDPTRYAINMEDSYGSKCDIHNNDIYDSFQGILVGCYDVDIYKNHIHDIDFYGINLYSVSAVKIRDNYMYNVVNNIGLMTPQFFSPYVLVEGNTFTNGTLNFTATSYRVELKHNQIINPASISIADNCTMSDCHVTFNENINGAWLLSSKVRNCTFKSNSTTLPQRELTVKTYLMADCTFENLRIRIEPLSTRVLSKCIITDSDFRNCEVRNHIFTGVPNNVEVSNSKVVDTTFEVGITNVDGQNSYTSLYNCTVALNGPKYLFLSDANRPLTTYKAEKCQIIIVNEQFDAMLNSGSAQESNELLLIDNDISYRGTTPLNLKFYKQATHMKNFEEKGNKFTNINLPA